RKLAVTYPVLHEEWPGTNGRGGECRPFLLERGGGTDIGQICRYNTRELTVYRLQGDLQREGINNIERLHIRHATGVGRGICRVLNAEPVELDGISVEGRSVAEVDVRLDLERPGLTVTARHRVNDLGIDVASNQVLVQKGVEDGVVLGG